MGNEKISPQKREAPRKKRPNSYKAKQRKINRYVRITGRVAFIIQAILSLILVLTISKSGLLPRKYILAISVGLAVLALITLMMNLRRNRRIRIAGICISTVAVVMVCVFTTYFNRTLGVIQSNSKALKTDNMIVVVREDDPAKVLVDAKDY